MQYPKNFSLYLVTTNLTDRTKETSKLHSQRKIGATLFDLFKFAA